MDHEKAFVRGVCSPISKFSHAEIYFRSDQALYRTRGVEASNNQVNVKKKFKTDDIVEVTGTLRMIAENEDDVGFVLDNASVKNLN